MPTTGNSRPLPTNLEGRCSRYRSPKPQQNLPASVAGPGGLRGGRRYAVVAVVTPAAAAEERGVGALQSAVAVAAASGAELPWGEFALADAPLDAAVRQRGVAQHAAAQLGATVGPVSPAASGAAPRNAAVG